MAFVAACVTIGPMADATAADKAVTAGDVIETHEHEGDFKAFIILVPFHSCRRLCGHRQGVGSSGGNI